MLGDQITDFIREVNNKREGKGSYYFEPEHLQYKPLRKHLLDIIHVQIAEGTGALTTSRFISSKCDDRKWAYTISPFCGTTPRRLRFNRHRVENN